MVNKGEMGSNSEECADKQVVENDSELFKPPQHPQLI